MRNQDGTFDVFGWPTGTTGLTNAKNFASKVSGDKLADTIGKDLADKVTGDFAPTREIRVERHPEGHTSYYHDDKKVGGQAKTTEDQIEALRSELAGVPRIKDYEGLDLKVGDGPMRKFYDKMLVDKANALGKKFGAKVEWQTLPGQEYSYRMSGPRNGSSDFVAYAERPGINMESSEHAIGIFPTEEAAKKGIADHKKNNPGIKVPVFRLNDKLRAAASTRGMPLFSSGLPFKFTPVDHDPFAEDK